MASSIPWKFVLTKVGLPLTDVVTDTKTGHDYIVSGETLWGVSILSVMVCPLISMLAYELTRYIHWKRNQNQDRDPEEVKWIRLKILSQIPIFGQLLHAYFAYQIKVENKKMTDSLETYRDIKGQIETKGKDNIEIDGRVRTVQDIANQLTTCSEVYTKAKKQRNRIMCIFQEIRLFEILGESGPQAALQICFALRKGYTGPWQVFSIIISLVSLGTGAAETVLLYQTKDEKIKREVSSKQTYLMIFPVMFTLSFPRLLTLGLFIAYARFLSLPFIALFFFVSCALSFKSLLRDPLRTICGALCNIFAPCIMIESGSCFLFLSSLNAIILHCISLIGLLFAIILQMPGFMPDNHNDPPITHCSN